jgi:hypothetical protein
MLTIDPDENPRARRRRPKSLRATAGKKDRPLNQNDQSVHQVKVVAEARNQKFLEEAPSCALNQRGCFSVNSMRELTGLPPEARKVIVDGRAKLKRLLKANIAAESPKMDVDVVCDLVSVFFSGICIEANLNTNRSRAQQKIENFMQMLRAA